MTKKIYTGNSEDIYIGMVINNYKIIEQIGHGKIGTVYKAIREDINHTVACKIIPEGKLKDGWEMELLKVVKLTEVNSVINYINHGNSLNRDNRPFTYIFWNYISVKSP